MSRWIGGWFHDRFSRRLAAFVQRPQRWPDPARYTGTSQKGRDVGLDAWLAEVQGVLDRPEEIVMIEHVPVRVNRMGVRVEGVATGPINEFTATEIRRPPDFSRIVVLVHCARADLPAKETAFPR